MTLRAENLTLARGDRIIVKNLTFQLDSGRALVLTGANGAGKSTLLRALSGLLPPRSGQIFRDQQSIDENPTIHLGSLAFIGHLDAIKPLLTVAENLAYWADGDNAAVAGALAGWDLTARANWPARFLSAGLKRRVALARLLLRPVGLWLLDEPTTALDQASVARFRDHLAAHLDRGGMAVIATHLDLGLATADRLELRS